MLKDQNKDLLNISNDVVWLLGNKSYDKPLQKDEILTYNACLRLIKAVADKVSNEYYVKPEEFNIKNDWDDGEPTGAPA